MPGSAESHDFEIKKYDADRNHEIALNEYTHALEVEQLKLLILLNGGAATALLAFVSDSAAQLGKPWFVVAIVIWLLGLTVGAGAMIGLRYAQSQYARFYRLRRQAAEWRQLRRDLDDKTLTLSIGYPTPELIDLLRRQERRMRRQSIDPKSLNRQRLREEYDRIDQEIEAEIKAADHPVLFDLAAHAVVANAHKTNSQIFWLSLLSVLLFAFGAVAAMIMVLSASDDRGMSPQSTANETISPARP